MGRGSGADGLGGSASRRLEETGGSDRPALRLLALYADGQYPRVLAAGDLGDEELDAGFLRMDDDEGTDISERGRDVLAQAEAGGLAQRSPAFRLLMSVYEGGVTEENEEVIAADLEAGLLVKVGEDEDGDLVGLSDAGLAQVQADLSLLLG